MPCRFFRMNAADFYMARAKGRNRVIYKNMESEQFQGRATKDGDLKLPERIICRQNNYALENDITLLGIYHSHPRHPAIPSEHDRIAAQPYFSYVIISVTSGAIDHIRSWQA